MIRKSWLLLTSILAGQFACVLIGVLWYAAWQERLWRDALQENFLTHNTLLTALHASKLARDQELPTAGPLSAEQRSALQDYVESISLRKRWYACIVDEDGAVAAHPELPASPQLRNTRPGRWLLHRPGQVQPLGDALAASPESAVAGWLSMPDGVHLVSARRIANTNLVMIVHQRAEALDSLAAAVTAPVRRVGLAIAVVLVFFTGLITRVVVNRYEHRLAVINADLESRVADRSEALVQTRDAVIFGLAKLADSRDHQTGEHVERLQQLACLLARQARRWYPEIDAAWIERLRLASALHDIGKVGIPDAVLLKPGPLTEAERRVMQRHAEIGAECLAAIGHRLGSNDFLSMARDIAYCHHEWWDGSGYPRGLSGADIPLAARIVAVADVYDAASSRRVYKDARSHEEVRGIVLDGSGGQFDPAVVEAFLRVEDRFRRLVHADTAGEAGQPLHAVPELVSVGD